MNETIISWNVPNWITVVLMVVIFFAAFGAISRMVGKKSEAE